MAYAREQDISFPYPQTGGVVRPPGQGCTSCVHNEYCQAYYWFRRYVQPAVDDHNGTNCLQWSDDPADRITKITQADLDYNEMLNEEGILTEPNRNGITEPVTGGRRREGSL